jgi:hypothetical protein
MATVAILEVVYIAKAPAHDGDHLCEVWLRKAHPFWTKMKWENFVYFVFTMATAAILKHVNIACNTQRYPHQFYEVSSWLVQPFQRNCADKMCGRRRIITRNAIASNSWCQHCGYHGNRGHVSNHTYSLWSSFLWNLSQNAELYPRNMKWKLCKRSWLPCFNMAAVAMVTTKMYKIL